MTRPRALSGLIPLLLITTEAAIPSKSASGSSAKTRFDPLRLPCRKWRSNDASPLTPTLTTTRSVVERPKGRP